MKLYLKSKSGLVTTKEYFGNAAIYGDSKDGCYVASMELARLLQENNDCTTVVFFTEESVSTVHDFCTRNEHCSERCMNGESVFIELTEYITAFKKRKESITEVPTTRSKYAPVVIFIDQDLLDFAATPELTKLWRHLSSYANRTNMYFYAMNSTEAVGAICGSHVKVFKDEKDYVLIFKDSSEGTANYRF